MRYEESLLAECYFASAESSEAAGAVVHAGRDITAFATAVWWSAVTDACCGRSLVLVSTEDWKQGVPPTAMSLDADEAFHTVIVAPSVASSIVGGLLSHWCEMVRHGGALLVAESVAAAGIVPGRDFVDAGCRTYAAWRVRCFVREPGHSGRRAADPFDLHELERVEPVSRGFGFLRGQPIDRYYIERFIARYAFGITGRVLEVGDDTYTRRYGRRVEQSDVLHVTGSPQATVVASLTDLPVSLSESFDCVICTQTLQLVFDVARAVSAIRRILKPGGLALLTVPGTTQIDDQGWSHTWQWSFTRHSINRLVGESFGPANVTLAVHGNVRVAVSFLEGLAVEDLPPAVLDVTDEGYPLLITAAAVRRDD